MHTNDGLNVFLVLDYSVIVNFGQSAEVGNENLGFTLSTLVNVLKIQRTFFSKDSFYFSFSSDSKLKNCVPQRKQANAKNVWHSALFVSFGSFFNKCFVI